MGLKLLKGPNGKLRSTWYADIRHDGRAVRLNLGVPVRGTPGRNAAGNPTIHGGDRDFEASRREAEARFKKIRDESKDDPAALIRKAYRVRTGRKLANVRLDELAARWRDLPRYPPATPDQLARGERIFADFLSFTKDYAAASPDDDPTAPRRRRFETINAVTPALALAYFQHAKGRVAWSTANSWRLFLSSAWRKFSTSGGANPFDFTVEREGEGDKTVHREQLDEDQLERLFDLARPDDFLYPLVVCAASTGLRLGDVCKLRWESVKFDKGVPFEIHVTTSKTGEPVFVPVFEKFAAVLERRLAQRESEPGRGEAFDPLVYVFPEAAKKYSTEGGQTSIVRAVKPLFARAVYGEPVADEPEDAEPLDPAAVESAIEGARWKDAKKVRILDVFRRFARGESYAAIRKATGRTSALVSQDLHAVELLVGRPVRPGLKTADRTALSMLDQTRKRLPGRRACSVYGWHSLRGTFATIALARGVPIETVAAIVGHTTGETTWKYYIGKKQAADQARDKLDGSVLGSRGRKRPADAAALPPASSPSSSSVPALANSSNAARAVALLRDFILDEDQRRRLATAADALGITGDAPAELLPLVERIMTDDQRARAADALRLVNLAQ